MTRDEIIDGRRAAAIRDRGKPNPGNMREPFNHDVLLAACPTPEHVV